MKASVTPRIGSGGPISMWLQTEDMVRAEVRETLTTRRASIMVRIRGNYGKEGKNRKPILHVKHYSILSSTAGILEGSARPRAQSAESR